MLNGNPLILRRLDELIAEGERIFEEYKKVGKGRIDDPVSASCWITSCLKNRARAAGLEITPKETLNPITIKLKAIEVGVLTEFEAKRLEAVAKMRNDAAHGGEFTYRTEQVSEALTEVRTTLERVLSAH